MMRADYKHCDFGFQEHLCVCVCVCVAVLRHRTRELCQTGDFWVLESQMIFISSLVLLYSPKFLQTTPFFHHQNLHKMYSARALFRLRKNVNKNKINLFRVCLQWVRRCVMCWGYKEESAMVPKSLSPESRGGDKFREIQVSIA